MPDLTSGDWAYMYMYKSKVNLIPRVSLLPVSLSRARGQEEERHWERGSSKVW